MVSTRTFDRIMGIFVTLGVGFALLAARSWVKRVLDENRQARRKKGGSGINNNNSSSSSSSSGSGAGKAGGEGGMCLGDELHRARYHKQQHHDAAAAAAGASSSSSSSQLTNALHLGACHCSRVRFRVKAPRVLYAVDIPSKLRFARLTIPGVCVCVCVC